MKRIYLLSILVLLSFSLFTQEDKKDYGEAFKLGEVWLDDEVGELLPWYDLKQDYPVSGPITVETLMTNSSGLPRAI
jgi:hypothetical protein